MSAVSVHSQEHRGEASGISPRNNIARPIFPRTVQEARPQAKEDAKFIIETAFPGPSENAICDEACKNLGLPDQGIIRNILRKETEKPDFAVLMASLGHIKDPWNIPRLRGMVAWIIQGQS